LVNENSIASLSCTDIHGNVDGDWVGDIADQYGINGNISEDPLLCDVAGGDFHLHSDSPCAWANNPECGYIGAHTVGCGETAGVIEASRRPLRILTSPNPFNPSTRILYRVPRGDRATPVALTIYDLAGRLIRRLVNARRAPGSYDVMWDGIDDTGASVAAGVYFCRLTIGEKTWTNRMVLLR
jgi:hypothetical protein